MNLHDPRIEELVDEFFQRRVDGVEALNVRPAGEMFGNLIQIFDLDLGIPVLLRIENDIRTVLACAETHIGLNFDVAQTFGSDAFLELGHKLFRTARLAIDILADKTDSAHRFLLGF
jgi:hypothetical protein